MQRHISQGFGIIVLYQNFWQCIESIPICSMDNPCSHPDLEQRNLDIFNITVQSRTEAVDTKSSWPLLLHRCPMARKCHTKSCH